MTPLDFDTEANIIASKMQRETIYMTPAERRKAELIASGICEDAADFIAYMEDVPCLKQS